MKVHPIFYINQNLNLILINSYNLDKIKYTLPYVDKQHYRYIIKYSIYAYNITYCCDEYKTHKLDSRTILFYLLDQLEQHLTLEDIYDTYKHIKEHRWEIIFDVLNYIVFRIIKYSNLEEIDPIIIKDLTELSIKSNSCSSLINTLLKYSTIDDNRIIELKNSIKINKTYSSLFSEDI